MAGRFAVETVFAGIDRVSKPVNRMAKRVNRFGRIAEARFAMVQRRLAGIGRAATMLGTAGLAGGIFLAQRALRSAIVTGAEFEQTMVNAAVKFPEGIRKGTKEFEELEAVVRRVGATTEFTASEAAQGLNFLAMAGFNAKQSMAALPKLVDLATASQTDLATASDIATDSLGAFGLASDDAAIRAKNLQRISDVLAKTTTTANTDMVQLFETIKGAGPVAQAAGISLETFAASAGVMANAGIKSTVGATTLKNAFTRLADPKIIKFLGRMGVAVTDGAGNFRDFFDITEDVRKATSKLGTQQKTTALDTIFGKRAIAGMNALMNNGVEANKKYRVGLEESTGEVNRMAKVMRDTLQGRFKTLISSTESLGLTLFNLKKGGMAEFLEGVTKWVRGVDEAVKSNEDFGASIIDGIGQSVFGVLGILGEFLVLMVALKFVVLAFQTVMLGFNVAVLAFKGVMALATAATWLFNAAMLANAFGLLMVGVAALAVAIVGLIANWDTVKSTVSSVVDFLTVKLGKFLDVVTAPFEALESGLSKLGGLVGFGDDEGAAGAASTAAAGVVSPADRVARSLEEKSTTNKTELTIRDNTGRAELTGAPGPGVGLAMVNSGGFTQ